MLAHRRLLQQAAGFKQECFNSTIPSNLHDMARAKAKAAGCLQYYLDNRARISGGQNSAEPCAQSLPFACARVFDIHYSKDYGMTNVTVEFQSTRDHRRTHTCLLKRGIVEYAVIIRNNSILLRYPDETRDTFIADTKLAKYIGATVRPCFWPIRGGVEVVGVYAGETVCRRRPLCPGLRGDELEWRFYAMRSKEKQHQQEERSRKIFWVPSHVSHRRLFVPRSNAGKQHASSPLPSPIPLCSFRLALQLVNRY